jgi:hypothetical protein
VLDTDKAAPALVQVAQGIPVNEGKPVTEINVAGAELIPVKLKVTVAAADATLLLNAMEAMYMAGTVTPEMVSITTDAALDKVLMTAVDAAEVAGFVNPVTVHAIAESKVVAVESAT